MASTFSPYYPYFGEDIYRDQLYTEYQSRLLTNLPRLTAPLSIAGSSIILYIILKDRKRKLKRVYHRLLFAYSWIDVICSFNYALSALVVPKGTPGVWGARGTLTTCEASGFITQFSFSAGVYATFICVYYVLVLRYGVRERMLAKKIEPFVHAFALIPPCAMGIFMLTTDNYNPTNVIVGWCFINVFPMDCLRRDEVECERGENYQFWLILNNVPFFFFLPTVFISNVLTYLKVRNQSLRSRRWIFSPSSSLGRAQIDRVRETAAQTFLYIGNFYFTYVFFGILTLVGPSPATKEHRNFYLPLVILTKIFLPLNGFWNFFIYIRPRYRAIQKRKPDLSMWNIFQIILSSSDLSQIRREDGNVGTGGKSSQRNWRTLLFGINSSSSKQSQSTNQHDVKKKKNREPNWRRWLRGSDANNSSEVIVFETEHRNEGGIFQHYQSEGQQDNNNLDRDEFIPEFNEDSTTMMLPQPAIIGAREEQEENKDSVSDDGRINIEHAARTLGDDDSASWGRSHGIVETIMPNTMMFDSDVEIGDVSHICSSAIDTSSKSWDCSQEGSSNVIHA